QETVGHGLPPRDRVRRFVPGDEFVWLGDELAGATMWPLLMTGWFAPRRRAIGPKGRSARIPAGRREHSDSDESPCRSRALQVASLGERRVRGDLVEPIRLGAGQLLPRRTGAVGCGVALIPLVLVAGDVGGHGWPFPAMLKHRFYR